MSQAGYTPISLYYSTTAAAVPTSGNLVAGELAINTLDGKLYYKNSAGTVTLLASTSGASGDVVGPASATDNALARFDLTTGKLIQNSVGILSDAGILTGLTGLTSSGSITLSSLTSGRVTFAGASGLLSDSANLQFTGTSLLVGSATATANFNFIASQSLDTTAGGMVENTSNTASATAVMRYKNSGSTFAYTGLGSPTRDVYAGLGPNVLAMYTGSTAGIAFSVDAAGPIKFVTNSTQRMCSISCATGIRCFGCSCSCCVTVN